MVVPNESKCSAENCSRLEGHEMPHGHEVRSGIFGMIVAPWSDSPRQRKGDSDDLPILCNSCGAPLMLDPERTRAACSSCNQRISFDERGYSQTVLPKMYPSKITDPKMMREMGEYRVGEWKFFDTLQLRFGLIDKDEFVSRRQNAAEKLIQFISDEVTPLEKAPWWKKLFA